MNAIDFLRQEHRNEKEKLQEIEHASPGRRGELWQELKPEMKVHEHIEDEFLYGPLSREPKAKGMPFADFQKHQDKDVAELEAKIAAMERLDAASVEWLTKLTEIRSALEDHIKEEEQDILPAIPKVWDQAKIDQAGTGMAEEKQRKLSEVAAR